MSAPRLVSDEELLADLRRIAKIAPGLTTIDIEKHGKYARMTYVKWLGSLDQMRRRIGWVAPALSPEHQELKARLAVINGWTEEECVSLFRRFRWPQEITCPRCEGSSINLIKNQHLTNPEIALYECLDERYQFSDIAGTVFHKCFTEMRVWFLVITVFTGAPLLNQKQQSEMIGMDKDNYRNKVCRLRGSKMVLDLAEHLNEKTGSQSHEQNGHHL